MLSLKLCTHLQKLRLYCKKNQLSIPLMLASKCKHYKVKFIFEKNILLMKQFKKD